MGQFAEEIIDFSSAFLCDYGAKTTQLSPQKGRICPHCVSARGGNSAGCTQGLVFEVGKDGSDELVDGLGYVVSETGFVGTQRFEGV